MKNTFAVFILGEVHANAQRFVVTLNIAQRGTEGIVPPGLDRAQRAIERVSRRIPAHEIISVDVSYYSGSIYRVQPFRKHVVAKSRLTECVTSSQSI